VLYTKIYITARGIIEKVKRRNTIFYLPLIVMVVLYTKIYITAKGIIEKVKNLNTTYL
jgi:hypothetical protein